MRVYFYVVSATQPETEITPYHPYAVGVGAFVILTVSLIVSGSVWWWQLTHQDTRITGTIVATSTNSITIIDARGSTTTVLTEKAERHKDTRDPTTFATGTPLMVRGQFIDKAVFEAAGIRPVGRRP